VKDFGVPGAKKELNTLKQNLYSAGFDLVHQEIVKTDEVSFAFWKCTIKS
jgi:hypothetical protein